MDVPLSLEQEARLALLAKSTGRDPQSLAAEAVGHLLDSEARFREAVERGLASLDRGEFVSHHDVRTRIDRLLQS